VGDLLGVRIAHPAACDDATMNPIEKIKQWRTAKASVTTEADGSKADPTVLHEGEWLKKSLAGPSPSGVDLRYLSRVLRRRKSPERISRDDDATRSN
jgi:hypothetical protein